jgi:phosphosulfolactate synthase
MNFFLDSMPERSAKPRESGLTMVMDKGLSVRQAEDMMEVSGDLIDIVKLGFGSSYVTPKLDKKLEIFRAAKMPFYFGGTLLEAFIARNQFEDYLKLLDKYKATHAEVSDGSITLPHDKKLDYIRKLSKYVTVITEVGSKEEGIIIHPNMWIEMMEKEIQAGAWKVIAEARESGTVGIYRPNGKAHVVLINKIISKIPRDKIIWETPNKSGQVYFINLLGANANLGNIAPTDVIPLESLRIGLRSDTFFNYLDKEKMRSH